MDPQDNGRWRAVVARLDAWRKAQDAELQARHSFEAELAAANDDGLTYRQLGEGLGWHHTTVGERINAARDRAQAVQQ